MILEGQGSTGKTQPKIPIIKKITPIIINAMSSIISIFVLR